MADPDMKDTENIPLNVSFEDYMNNDVLPYAPETWIDESVRDKGPLADGQIGVVGTSINFNKFFYHYEESRNPEEIAKEIMELESGLEELDYEGVSRMREMTMSGEVWIGNRPVDWEENKIKYVAPIHNERASTNEGYIGLENIESWTGKLLPSDSVATGESVAFQKNDVLFGKLRPYLAKSFLAKQSGCGSTELLVMCPDGISPEYLAYIMRSKTLVDCIDVSTYGAKMPRANGDFIKNLRVPLPPLSEQHTIVRYLDSKCAAIDEAIKRHRKIIEKLEEYRAEVVTNAVTGKIDCREA